MFINKYICHYFPAFKHHPNHTTLQEIYQTAGNLQLATGHQHRNVWQINELVLTRFYFSNTLIHTITTHQARNQPTANWASVKQIKAEGGAISKGEKEGRGKINSWREQSEVAEHGQKQGITWNRLEMHRRGGRIGQKIIEGINIYQNEYNNRQKNDKQEFVQLHKLPIYQLPNTQIPTHQFPTTIFSNPQPSSPQFLISQKVILIFQFTYIFLQISVTLQSTSFFQVLALTPLELRPQGELLRPGGVARSSREARGRLRKWRGRCVVVGAGKGYASNFRCGEFLEDRSIEDKIHRVVEALIKLVLIYLFKIIMDLLFHFKLKFGSRPILLIIFRYFLLSMSSSYTTTKSKKTYDDIPYEKRRQLINLIDSGNWTIRGAAEETGIKLCTAKYILYHYRKNGKVYGKKRGNLMTSESPEETVDEREAQNIVYVPCPVYIFCYIPSDQMPNQLTRFSEI